MVTPRSCASPAVDNYSSIQPAGSCSSKLSQRIFVHTACRRDLACRKLRAHVRGARDRAEAVDLRDDQRAELVGGVTAVGGVMPVDCLSSSRPRRSGVPLAVDA